MEKSKVIIEKFYASSSLFKYISVFFALNMSIKVESGSYSILFALLLLAYVVFLHRIYKISVNHDSLILSYIGGYKKKIKLYQINSISAKLVKNQDDKVLYAKHIYIEANGKKIKLNAVNFSFRPLWIVLNEIAYVYEFAIGEASIEIHETERMSFL